MRKFIPIIVLSLFSLTAFAQTNHSIETSGTSFAPDQLTIEVGDTVTWTNTSMGFHNVNGSQGTFGSNPEGFANGGASSTLWTFSHTFTMPGTYNFQCDPHAGANMNGTIIVNEASGGLPNIVITEIMYNPPESGQDSLEFVELYNNGDAAVDLFDYRFIQGADFIFTENFMLGAGEYVIIASNATAFENNFGTTAFEFTGGSFSNGGEDIIFATADSTEIDVVDYDDGNGWPTEADGFGASLVLCDVDADNNLPENWAIANTPAGFSINDTDVYANPNATSACPSGAVIRFIENGVEVDEAVGTFEIGVEISNAAQETYSVALDALLTTTAVFNIDFTFDLGPVTIVNPNPVDTFYFTITVTDDMDQESIEEMSFLFFAPSSNLTIQGIGGTTSYFIADNDSNVADIVITEIMYNLPGGDEMHEYVELYNNGSGTVNLDGYYFSDGITDTLHAIDLAAGDYLLLTIDSVTMEAAFGVTAYQWTDGNLTNTSETIELRDPLGNVVDVVTYDDSEDGWPSEPDGSGAALVLCDPSSDNSVGANWIAGVEASGVFVNGSQILGSPGAANDCTPPEPMGYTVYDIGQVTGNDADGVADSLGVLVELTGVLYGVNLHPNGTSFTIIDGNGDGIAAFSNSNGFDYTVTEGDEVTLQGTIGQYNGLTQINLDTVMMNSAGNALVTPAVVTALDETTESQLVVMEGVTIDSWFTAGGGLNVTILDENANPFTVRVDFDTDVTEQFIMDMQGELLNITGLGGQFDGSVPHDEGYQLAPRYQGDFDVIIATNEPAWATGIKLSPNPAQQYLKVELPVEADQLQLMDALGRLMINQTNTGLNATLELNNLPSGTYFLRVIEAGEIAVRKVIKQ